MAAVVLFVNGQSPLPSIQSPAYLISYITSNPVLLPYVKSLTLVFLIPFGPVLNSIGFAIAIFFVLTRNIFAYAFDRVTPVRFANVNRRGAPYFAVIVYALIAYFSL